MRPKMLRTWSRRSLVLAALTILLGAGKYSFAVDVKLADIK
jgi:hypothetical protein